MFHKIVLMLIIILSVFLCGYAYGRRVGLKQGIKEGEIIIPLDLKRKMLETSFCPICFNKLKTITNCGNIHNREV
jgi:hypothetical protein